MTPNYLRINDIKNSFIHQCVKMNAISKKSNYFLLNSVNILFYLQLVKVRRLLKVCVGAIGCHFFNQNYTR
jgi:hypothetical protein